MHSAEIQVKAAPETIYKLYENVSKWNEWDIEVIESELDLNNSFSNGATGLIVPRFGPKAKITFHNVVPNKAFTASSKLPLCVMSFVHEIYKDNDIAIVKHSLHFSGLLSSFFRKLIGNKIAASFTISLAGLKKRAEEIDRNKQCK